MQPAKRPPSAVGATDRDHIISWIIVFPKNVEKLISNHFFQDAIDRWLESADFDSDGRISMEEFKLSIAGNTLVDELD